MSIQQRLREAHATNQQQALESNLLLDAANRIKDLELELGLMTSSRDHKARHLESCERALEERDSQQLNSLSRKNG